MRERRITIEPFAGLGNRMRAMDSAVGLAAEEGVRLRVVWTRTPDFNCSFRDLFEVPEGIELRERTRDWDRFLRLLYARLRRSRVFEQREMEQLRRDPTPIREALSRQDVHIVTGSWFFPSPRPYACFRPIAAIRQEIDAQLSRFGTRTVGVHIRRTDNVQAIDRSPTRLFIERMAAELRQAPDTTFFLATDSPTEEACIAGNFPNRVQFRPKALDRGDPQALRDAVVDLYCLAHTRSILGSYWSSFSAIAAALGGVKLEVVDRTGEFAR